MNLELPPIIQKYVEASNQHDVKSLVDAIPVEATRELYTVGG
jgi:hypothetical protein